MDYNTYKSSLRYSIGKERSPVSLHYIFEWWIIPISDSFCRIWLVWGNLASFLNSDFLLRFSLLWQWRFYRFKVEIISSESNLFFSSIVISRVRLGNLEEMRSEYFDFFFFTSDPGPVLIDKYYICSRFNFLVPFHRE